MTLLQRLFTPKADPRDALRPLWHAIVAEARRPAFFIEGGVEDSVSGRFDILCAVLATVLLRMEQGDNLARESVLLTELFVQDMDGQLREFGVGDVVVGKRVGKLMGAMGGRLGAYRQGLAGDGAALAEAVRRNVTMRQGGSAEAVAQDLRHFADRLARTSDADLLAGVIAA